MKMKESCNYHYNGCTEEATTSYFSPVSYKSFPCCENCLDIRIEKEAENNDKYMNITPFTGMNEYGEYYDEDSY